MMKYESHPTHIMSISESSCYVKDTASSYLCTVCNVATMKDCHCCLPAYI